MTIETIVANSSLILIVVAVICTLVSVITEFTKEVGFLKNIPTALQVLVTSLIVTTVTFFSYTSYASISFYWYYLVAIIFASFLIAIICAKGWEYLIDIWKRFYRKGQ